MEQVDGNLVAASHNRPRLLIVDDQPTNIRVFHELFREDCDVFMATAVSRRSPYAGAYYPI